MAYRCSGDFLYRNAVMRLVGEVLAEQLDGWIQRKRYMSLTNLAQTKETTTAGVIDEEPINTKETPRMINIISNLRAGPDNKHED